MSQNTSAISGKIDIFTAWNNYIYIYSANQVSSWPSNQFGTYIYDGNQSVNGINWTNSLEGPQYGDYTNGYYVFTLEGDGNWAVDGGDLTNVQCVVASTGSNPQTHTGIAYIMNGYYHSSGNTYAIDYRCDFEATNWQPSYLYFRVGTNSTSTSVIPIMNSWNITGTRVRPRIRNVSFTYNTSSESLENAALGDLINGQKNIYNQNKDYYDKNYEAVDNIDNQSSSDIQGAENAQTTNLINVISGFISAFSSISAGNCNLTLEFPDYAGGTRVVNICSGKEKAPRIVEIGSSLLLICVFVPLAYILIRMIYNEIRSWTNG